MKLFRDTCFGHLLDMPSIKRSSKILGNLMMRTGYYEGVPPSNDKLLILIGGLPRKFTRQQFGEITRLKIDNLYNKKDYEY